MNKQRKFILIASVVGILAMFLPWVDSVMINYNGMHGKGILVFICFLTSCLISLYGNQSLPLDNKMWMITLIAGALALLLMIITFFELKNAFLNVFGYGFYIDFLAAIGLLIAAYHFRAPGQNLKSGFDSLKK